MKVKTIIIALLVVVNVLFLGGLLLRLSERDGGVVGLAYAQPMPGSPRYLMVVGRYGESDQEQALYVVNLERRMLAVFTFDQGKERLSYNGRTLLGTRVP